MNRSASRKEGVMAHEVSALSDRLSPDLAGGSGQEPTTGIQFRFRWTICSECRRLSIELRELNSGNLLLTSRWVHPKGISRAPLSPEVPEKFARDYTEACIVFPDSEKASPALSR